MHKLTQKRLKEVLNYNSKTGLFRWRVSRKGYAGKAKQGSVAGSPDDRGYINIGIDGASYGAHRLAYFYMTGTWPATFDIDHHNRCKGDNRWNNLRPATRSQTRMNSILLTNNKSGVKGIRFRSDKKKWLAFIGINKKQIHIGYFKTKGEAIAARSSASIQYHKEFACL